MTNLELNSSLSEEKIEKNFEGVDFFEGLMEGLQQALDYEDGKTASGTVVHVRTTSAQSEHK